MKKLLKIILIVAILLVVLLGAGYFYLFGSSTTSAFFDWNRSLVGYWSFDYYNGTNSGDIVYDNSTWGNNGTLDDNSINTSFGIRGHALWNELVPATTHVTIPDSASLDSITDAMTVSVWIHCPSWSVAGNLPIVDKWWDGSKRHFYVWSDNDGLEGELMVGLSRSDGAASQLAQTTTSLDLAINTWYHLVVTWDKTNGSALVYVNGTLAETLGSGATQSMSSNNEDLKIGMDYNDDDEFRGHIDEVAIWNRALSAEEILALYDNTANRLSHNFTNISQGIYNYTAYAIDTEGNLNITPMRSVTYTDNTPTFSVSPAIVPTNGNTTDNLNCTFTLTDDVNTSLLVPSWYQE
jgi:hypothetical protein